jgi:hypothetical protein
MAIVKKVKGEWKITRIGLSDWEVEDLQSKLKMSDENSDYVPITGYTIRYQPNED